MITIKDKRLALQQQYPGGNCVDWDYNFYVVNRNDKFVFGFDTRDEAYEYVKELRKDRTVVRVVPKREAMRFTYPPQFEHSWTDDYKHVPGLTED